MRVVPLVFAPVLTLAASHSTATTIHVPGDEPTIAAGIAAASVGDTVLVACGEYVEGNVVLDKEIVLRGETGTPDCVTWEGVQHLQTILTIQSVGAGARVEGITLSGPSRPKLEINNAGPRITDCDILGGPDSGLAIEMTSSSPLLTRCAIRDNVDRAVRSYDGSPEFVSCEFVSNGGGAILNFGGSLSVIDCRFLGNGAAYGGGAILSYGDSLSVIDCSFLDNRAANEGGAILMEGEHLSIAGTVFESNTAFGPSADGGGAVSSHRASIAIDSCEFSGNAARVGGAITAFSSAPFSLTRSLFARNSCENYGGACAFSHVNATVAENRFFENEAGGDGGALAILGSSSSYATNVSDCTFMRNSANRGHGVAAWSGTTVNLFSSLISHGLGGSPTARLHSSATLTFDCCDVYDPIERDPEFYAHVGVNSNFSADPIFCDEGSAGTAIADGSWCRPEINGCGLVGVPDPGTCAVPGVYVATNPPGLWVDGEGLQRRGAAFYRWDPGTTHTIATLTPQDQPERIRYVFTSWDDGGDLSHPIAVSGDFQVHTASFDSLYLYSASTTGVGTVTPPDSQWIEPGTEFEIVATPGTGWLFERWEGQGEGSYTGTDSAATVTMNEPISQRAFFVSGPTKEVTVHTDPQGLEFRSDGTWYTAPHTFVWDVGPPHGLRIDEFQWILGLDGRQRFTRWSNDHVTRSFVYHPTHGSPDTVTAFFGTEYQLTFVADPGGSTTPDGGWFAPGTEVEIEAIPDFGYVFEQWLGFGAGSYTGPDNPATITMNESIRQRPLFSPIGTGYDFTISASDTDPDVQIADPTGGMRNLYLWATCNDRGITAMECATTGSLEPIAFVPLNGVFNVGTPTELLLAVPSCPTGPDLDHLLGYWIVQDDGGTLCLGPSQANGIMGAVDCEVPIAHLWPFRITGFVSDGSAPCFEGLNGCGEDPVPVGLTQLRAVAEDRAVRLSWISSSQIEYDGFWIYRSGSRTGGFVKLTPDLWRSAAPYEYLDREVEGDHTYFYRVGAVDQHGVEELSDVAQITTPDWKPFVTGLTGIHPNPFLSTSEIQFSVARRGPVRVTIYDVSGRLIRTIVSGELPAGEHSASWDGRNGGGALVTAGVYFTRFEAADASQTKKTVFLGGR